MRTIAGGSSSEKTRQTTVCAILVDMPASVAM